MVKKILSKRVFIVLVIGLFSFLWGCNKSKGIVENTNIPNNTNTINIIDTNKKHKVLENKRYYVLVSEKFKLGPDIANGGTIVRSYICYDGTENKKEYYPFVDNIDVAGVSNLKEAKEKLAQTDTEDLKLPPWTIVSDEVLKQWEAEEYEGRYEYNEEYPSGLNFELLLAHPCEVIDNKLYYVLLEESFKPYEYDSKFWSLERFYMCYDGTKHHQRYPVMHTVIIEKSSNLKESKEKLAQTHPKGLNLYPNTIVCNEVLKQWEEEGYNPIYEYHDYCPKGLTYEQLLK